MLEMVTVRLEVEAEPGILVSRLKPPLIELSNPFGAGIFTAAADGKPYPDDPEFYYVRLDPRYPQKSYDLVILDD